MLAVIIMNRIDSSVRMELRACETLDRIWSLQLKVLRDQKFSFRCCSFHWDEWLVTDFNDRRLLYISNDGKLKTTIQYNEIPYCISRFGQNMIAVSNEKGINFHKIKARQ